MTVLSYGIRAVRRGRVSRMNSVVCLPTLDALREHVRNILCAHDQLDAVQTPLHQAVITRSGRPCGLFFQVQGPRMVKTYAFSKPSEP